MPVQHPPTARVRRRGQVRDQYYAVHHEGRAHQSIRDRYKGAMAQWREGLRSQHDDPEVSGSEVRAALYRVQPARCAGVPALPAGRSARGCEPGDRQTETYTHGD